MPAPRLVTAVLALAATACGQVVVLEAGDPVDFVQQPQTSLVLAADGTLLTDLHAEEDRHDVALADVAPELVSAVVAVEDRRFFAHAGVDVPAIVRALVANVGAGAVEQGGSTITQQYVKNTMTGPTRTLERKVREAALAYQLEQRYGKEDILERYLNTIYFGHGAYGVAAAAERFFDTGAGDLSLGQAALLAGLVASPATYDPYEDPRAALHRREAVLDAMVATGRLDPRDAAAAASEPLDLAPLEVERASAPYAVEAVKRTIARDDAFRALGATEDERTAALFTGGLRIHTTIDPRAQAAAEAAVAEVLHDPADPSAALVAIDPRTGGVTALVGGRDFYDLEDPQARFDLATQGRRQPGSAFKPVVLATALSSGVGLDDRFPGGSEVEIDDRRCRGPDGPWRPANYDGRAYGSLTLREATVHSVNTVYARLSARVGPDAVVATARDLGVNGDLEAVCSIALGTEEVSPWDLAEAYVPFAALGRQRPAHLVSRIERADGTVLYERPDASYEALDPAVAYLVADTLTEVVSRGTGVRAVIDRPQAGKTGTTDDASDAWFVGFTPDLVAAVWVGFPDGRVPMVPPRTRELVEGGRWPAEIWAGFARDALAGVPETDFEVPPVDLVTVAVDVTRNCLPNPYTPPELVAPREYLAGTEPTELCREPTGPPEDAVPSLVGLTEEIAVRLLEAKGFVVAVRPIASPVYPPGYVSLQRPVPGAQVDPGTGEVTLWVSVHSRAQATVRDVVEVGAAEAVALLEADGWVVEVVTGCPAAGCPPDAPPGRVYAQEPAAGERAEVHSVVTLRVYPDA